jgi:hypothetical protein
MIAFPPITFKAMFPSFETSFVMAVVSFQITVLLFAAMGAVQMATVSLLL